MKAGSKAEPKPNYEDVQILRADVVIGSRLLPVGEIVKVEASTAEELVERGGAAYATKVRSLQDNVIIGNHVTVRGQVVITSAAIAAARVATGLVEFYTEGMGELPPAPLPKPRPEPPDPYQGMTRVKVKVLLEGFKVDNRIHLPGDVVDAPEMVAINAIQSGMAQLYGGAHLTPRGSAYQEELRRPRPDYAPRY